MWAVSRWAGCPVVPGNAIRASNMHSVHSGRDLYLGHDLSDDGATSDFSAVAGVGRTA